VVVGQAVDVAVDGVQAVVLAPRHAGAGEAISF